MSISRETNESSVKNRQALVDGFQGDAFQKVIFFASPTEGGTETDGPNTNWPLMSALATHHDGGYTIYDGVFLHASRYERFTEVKDVLDAAMESDFEVEFAPEVLNFTSHMSPNGAVAAMLSVQTQPLDPDSRAEYFKLLSPTMTEKIHMENRPMQ